MKMDNKRRTADNVKIGRPLSAVSRHAISLHSQSV